MVGYRAKMNRRLQRSEIKRIQAEKTGGAAAFRLTVDAGELWQTEFRK